MEKKMEKMLKKMYEDYYKIEEEESLNFLNSYDVQEAQEIELIDEEENYTCYVKEMFCNIDDILDLEYKRGAVKY